MAAFKETKFPADAPVAEKALGWVDDRFPLTNGRVFKNKPAPDNLQVPRHMYLSDTKLLIGKDEKGEA